MSSFIPAVDPATPSASVASGIWSRRSPWRHWLVAGVLGGLLLLGLAIWRDYGVSYDAGQSRAIGMVSLRYVAERLDPGFIAQPSQRASFEPFQVPLGWFTDRDYGVAYELPVTLGERLLHLSDDGDIYRYRHLCTFLVSWVGLLAMYGLGKRRYQDWRVGLAAVALLVLSPRLFGEFFYNDKDAVFMALAAVATYTAVRFLERPNWRTASWHALACAIAIDVRIMAVLWPVATVGLLGWRAYWGDYALRRRRLLGLVGLYAGLLAGLVVLCWPYLWEAPLHNFLVAFRNMQHFRWGGQVLYRGELITAPNLPWHYAPKWIGITTPLLQLGLSLLGIGLVGWQLLRRGGRLYAPGTREWQDILFAGLSLGPVLAVIVLHSVLYDGWRQLYFVYPSLLLLALRALHTLVGWLRPRPYWQQGLAASLLVAGLLEPAAALVQLHPLESLYFNVLAGPNAASRYEQDYWGISFLQGLRWVAAHDARPVVRVCTDPLMAPPLGTNYFLLTPAQRARIQVVEKPEQADYYLANYRWHPQEYDFPHKVQEIKVDNRRVLSIFALQ